MQLLARRPYLNSSSQITSSENIKRWETLSNVATNPLSHTALYAHCLLWWIRNKNKNKNKFKHIAYPNPRYFTENIDKISRNSFFANQTFWLQKNWPACSRCIFVSGRNTCTYWGTCGAKSFTAQDRRIVCWSSSVFLCVLVSYPIMEKWSVFEFVSYFSYFESDSNPGQSKQLYRNCLCQFIYLSPFH